MDSELTFEPSSLRSAAEPGRQLPCTDRATAERGVLVKDRTQMVIVVTDRTDL